MNAPRLFCMNMKSSSTNFNNVDWLSCAINLHEWHVIFESFLIKTYNATPFPGPPGPPAGVYIKLGTVTTVSAIVVWSVGPGMGHFGDILGYDIEAEISLIRPDEWFSVKTGTS